MGFFNKLFGIDNTPITDDMIGFDREKTRNFFILTYPATYANDPHTIDVYVNDEYRFALDKFRSASRSNTKSTYVPRYERTICDSPYTRHTYHSHSNTPVSLSDSRCQSKSSNDSDDFLLSAVVGAATNSSIIGGLVGGDFLGGVVGDILGGSDDSLF